MSNRPKQITLLGARRWLTPTAQLEIAAQRLNEAAVRFGLNSGVYKEEKKYYEELIKRLKLD